MPLFDNHFAGHMLTGDPRSPIFAAAGCVWPTCPAWRYRAMSDDASGRFAQLNDAGILLELPDDEWEHDDTTWEWLDPEGDILLLTARKEKDPDNPFGSVWAITIEVLFGDDPAEATIINPAQKCNVDLPIGAIGTGDPDQGTTGDTFRLEQVEFNKEDPPP